MHGLGIDVIEIERIERAVARWGDRFLSRIYTRSELDYCLERRHPGPSLAVRFAAKEAFAKAIEDGLHPSWLEVEVAMQGPKPSLQLAERLAAHLADSRIRVSLSHSNTVAVAVVTIGAV